MKIFHIFILYVISDPVSCYDVIGYSGGSIIIFCNHQQYGVKERHFCKINKQFCEKNIAIQNQVTQVHEDRFSLFYSPGTLTVVIRQLRLQDAGIYNCGESGVWNHFINLKVNKDPCCSGPTTITGYLGQTVTIRCSYQEVFETIKKYLFKQESLSFVDVISTTGTETHKDRFSMSDDKSAKIVSVTISDVREADGGVYSCGALNGDSTLNYYSLFTDVQLYVTERSIPEGTETPAPDGPAPDDSSVIITVCICIILLLIGGSAVTLYKLKCNKTKGPVCHSTLKGTHGTIDVDYENDPSGNQNIEMDPVYQTLDFNTNQSDSGYQTLNPDMNHSTSD
ncbi:polymeric immunoglobulin receptor-like [Brachyhypopomus gauderio]|uniref:polymeric immunoglobulin receptor-like n=1 Tax=Brachyhypopomus gauderio TaxID=698409 RepID=UPI004041790D